MFTAKRAADKLDMDPIAVVAAILRVSAADFDKSMTSIAEHRIWQDVYKTVVYGREPYVKITLDARREFLLISFKEA